MVAGLVASFVLGVFFSEPSAYAAHTASITLTGPGSGEIVSGSVEVTWSYTVFTGTTPVIVEAAPDGTTFSQVAKVPIDDGTSGRFGSVSWDTSTFADSNTYAVRVRVVTNKNAVSVASPVIVDNTAPTLTGSTSPEPNANGWNNSDVTVSWTCTDAGSGVDPDEDPADEVIASEGAGQSRTETCQDLAGNVSTSATVSDIDIDKTAPTLTGSKSPDANANGWNNSDVTVSWTCTDAGSGVDPAEDPADEVIASEGAEQSRTETCQDLAGNASTPATVSDIDIDKTAPTLTGSTSPEPNANGWNNSEVTVSWTCTDAGSGVDPDEDPADEVIATEGAGQSRNATCQDLAGNVSTSATVSDINIDVTTPVTTVSATLAGGQLSGTAFDQLSLVEETEVRLTSLTGTETTIIAVCTGCGTDANATWTASTAGVAPGRYTVEARSTDRAGNVGDYSAAVMVLVTG